MKSQYMSMIFYWQINKKQWVSLKNNKFQLFSMTNEYISMMVNENSIKTMNFNEQINKPQWISIFFKEKINLIQWFTLENQ